MQERVKEYIRKMQLFSDEEKLLLTISGGADSVCLMYMLLEIGYYFELAHCNFNLRDKESDEDEEFVRNLARKHKLKLHCKSFATEEYAKERKISIQMAAREQRYTWFNNLLLSEDLRYIVTAHHQDDVIETFLINLIRGTGILGLTSIPNKNRNIVRPLICMSRNEIEQYLSNKQIEYRDDSSNMLINYQRNKIRHQLLPLFEDINPNVRNNIINEIVILKDINTIFSMHVDGVKDKLLVNNDGTFSINITKLKELTPLRIYLFELLKQFGFKQIDAIIRALDNQSGKQFLSKKYQLIIDRKQIFISKIDTDIPSEVMISESETLITDPIKLKISSSTVNEINRSKIIAQFDHSKLEFPLILRRWKQGDRFYPLGMNKSKKLSDFFIDNKFSQLQKNKQWLLCSKQEIVWVIGHRIDNRFKVGPTTKKLYIAELL